MCKKQIKKYIAFLENTLLNLQIKQTSEAIICNELIEIFEKLYNRKGF